MTRTSSLLVLLSLGCSPPPDLCTAAPLEVDFGEVQAGPMTTYERPLRVTNSSGEGVFFFAHAPRFPFAVEPEGRFFVKARSESFLGVQFTALDSLLHFGELKVSGEEGRCALSVPLRALGSGLIRPNPPALEFTLGAGEPGTKELLIENTQRKPATVELSWSAIGGPAPLSFGGQSTREIPAGGSIIVPITASPQGWEPIDTNLFIRDQRSTPVRVLITPSSPRLEVTPLTHDIPRVGLGHYAERTFLIRNSGRSGAPSAPPLQLARVPEFVPGDSPDVDVFVPAAIPALREGEHAEFTVRVHPSRAGPGRYRFQVTPIHRFLPPVEVSLTSFAEVLPRCELVVDPAGVLLLRDSGDGGVNGRVTFTNTGSTRCIVDDLRLSANTLPGHSISPALAQVVVPAGGAHEVTVAGPGGADGGVVGELRFHVFRDGGLPETLELRSP